MLCCLHLSGSGFPPCLVFHDPRRFLDELSPLLRFRLNEICDPLLLYYRIGSCADTYVHEKFLHIEEAAGDLVYVIFRLAFAKYLSGDGNLLIAGIFLRYFMAIALQCYGYLSHADCGCVVASVEDDILHLFPAEHRDTLLTHNPSYGVHDIAFSAPVRPNDGVNVAREIDGGFIPEGFESEYFQFF